MPVVAALEFWKARAEAAEQRLERLETVLRDIQRGCELWPSSGTRMIGERIRALLAKETAHS